MILTPDVFENVIAQLNNQSAVKPDHYVLNVHQSLRNTIDEIKNRIAETTDKTKLLFNLDVRPIFHPEGNQDNWSIEACSKSKSLALIGQIPTA